MFRKTLAAATTALVAAIFTFGAVAAPAIADDGSGAGASSTTATATATTDSTAASPDTTPPASTPAASSPASAESTPATPSDPTPVTSAPTTTTPSPTTTTPAADPQPSTPPVATQAAVSAARTAPVAPALRCLPDRAVSYSYDRTKNSGVITVRQLNPNKFSDQLCTGFYVTAAGWRFLNLEGESYMWPQGLIGYNEANDGNAIQTVGSYDFGFPVTCGQGDIYADTKPVERPSGILESPSKPYQEKFLQDLFRDQGPYPTSMWTGPNDHTGQYCQVIDDKKVAPEVSTQCIAPRITWTDQPGKVTYALTEGNGVSGVNKVTATAGTGWVFPDNSTTWVYTVDLDENSACDATPGDPSSTPAVCTNGVVGNGTIIVELQPGVLDYTVTYPNGTTSPVTASPISAPVGSYTVHVSAAPGHSLQNPGNWTVVGPNSWELSVSVLPPVGCAGDLPTDAVLPTFVQGNKATCSTGQGSILVGPTADYLTVIDYFIDGVKVTKPTTSVATGTHTVTAAVNQTTAPGDTLENPGPWSITVGAGSTACGQLKTLALTGTSPTAPLLAAGILLPAGAALLLGAALIRRRREQ